MSDQKPIACASCGQAIEDPADAWPDESGGDLCQGCWEAVSSSLWWEMLNHLPLAMLEEGDHAASN